MHQAGRLHGAINPSTGSARDLRHRQRTLGGVAAQEGQFESGIVNNQPLPA
jgi:hypothetical protein